MKKKETETQAAKGVELDPVLVAFGQRVHELRNAKGLSQKALGSAIGSSQSHIHMIEIGVQNTGIATVLKIAKALGVKAGDLISTEPKSAPTDAGLERVIRAFTELSGKVDGLMASHDDIRRIFLLISSVVSQLETYLEAKKGKRRTAEGQQANPPEDADAPD